MTPNAMDSTLTAVALIEAFMARDRERIDALLPPGEDATAIVERLLALFEQVLISASGGHPQKVLDSLRSKLLDRIAGQDGEQ